MVVPLTDGYVCIDPEGDWIRDQQAAIDESEAWLTVQAAFCTRDPECQAEPDRHEPDCPVEKRLREEIGF